jgi:hypothetical protein
VTTTKKRLSRVQRHASLEMTGAVCTTCTGAMETLAFPHRSWYLRLRRGQLCIISGVLHVGRTFTPVRHSILMQLQQLDPIFNMGVDLILNPIIGLLCLLEGSSSEELRLLRGEQACLVYGWVQDGGNRGLSLPAIRGKKAEFVRKPPE